MELTVNTFLKGLLTDIHPMVQGNDVLSDALNATFVTMNGNEIILQNDMGNRRIDNAFLPPGYEPVGIKEYGGVIYIAAYNPITNTSLVGSFPSPERKLSSEDFKDGKDNADLKGDLEVSSFIKTKEIVNDSILISLTNKNTLHAGDKFVVYSDLNNLISKDGCYLSNYNNIDKGKVISPKNKHYTLALGILNSLNEFVDITKSLVRWNITNNTIMEDLNGKSDLYKFNAGYFIPKSYIAEKFLETIKDRKLILKRLVIPANTYAYKLVGPLYLKVTLNHILEFNYNIYGSKIGEGNNTTKYEIVVEGYATYNCPDNITSTNDTKRGDDNYDDYQEGKLNSTAYWPFTFNYNSNNEASFITKEETVGTLLDTEKCISVYNPETNLYSIKVVKKYEVSSSSDTLHYALGVTSLTDDEKNAEAIIPSLSSKGVLDLSKLGSGEIDLKGWRFYNKDGNTKLLYILEAYPKYGLEFTGVTMEFKEVLPTGDGTSKFTVQGTAYNGKNTVDIDWAKYNVKPRTLYKVTITYTENNKYPPSTAGNGNNGNGEGTNNNSGPNNAPRRNRGNEHQVEEINWKLIKDDIISDVPIYSEIENQVINFTDTSAITGTSKDLGVGKTSDIFYRWFLSTQLLNDCYNSINPLFIKDFCLPESNNEIEILKGKLSLLPKIDISIKDTSSYREPQTSGKWIDKLSENEVASNKYIEIENTYKYNFNVTLTPTIKILNEELYPEWAILTAKKLIYRIVDSKYVKKTTDEESKTELKKYYEDLLLIIGTGLGFSQEKLNKYKSIEENGGSLFNTYFVEGDNNILFTGEKIEINNLNPYTYTKELPFRDTITSKGSSDGTIETVYGGINEFIDSTEINDTENVKNIAFGCTFEHYNGSPDEHILVFRIITGYIDNIDDVRNDRIQQEYGDSGCSVFPFNDGNYSINGGNIWHEEVTATKKAFTDTANENGMARSVLTFFYDMYNNETEPSLKEDRSIIARDLHMDENDPENKSRGKYARVFWRKANGYWVILDKQLERNTLNSTDFGLDKLNALLKQEIFKGLDIIYCYALGMSALDLKIYHISGSDDSKKYNGEYSIEMNIYICPSAEVVNNYLPIKVKNINSTSSTSSQSIENDGEDTSINGKHIYSFFQVSGENETIAETISSPIPYKITLNSSEDFLSTINKMSTNTFKDISIDGELLSINGEELNPNKLYKMVNGKLQEAELKNYKVTKEYGKAGYNTIVYNGQEKAELTEPFDLNPGDSHGDTAIYYTGFDLYKPVM